MKTLNSKWFECKVRYDKMLEDGTQKKVTEQYVVDAVSFAEAEARVTDEVSAFISGEFDIVAEKIAPYREVFIGDGDVYYQCRVNIITLDEKTDKEKKSAIHHLVLANSFDDARRIVANEYDKSMVDYVIAKLSETPTVDLFVHEA